MASAEISIHKPLPPHTIGQRSPPRCPANSEPSNYGVLLYYCIARVDDVQGTCDRLRHHSEQLSLVGRIRVSPQGLNVTVAGTLRSLEEHIEEVCKDPRYREADFKIAPCSWPPPSLLARECGLSCLTVRAVEELVTLGGGRKSHLSCAGSHLSPSEFHSLLVSAPSSQHSSTPSLHAENPQSLAPERFSGSVSPVRDSPKVVVLDARNIYETRVGHFEPPPGVPLLNPRIRQFSDLPKWIDEHEDELKGKTILMYCTGGVRCEGASAYIRAKGPEFNNTFQLSGGIVRYLEAFPEGGLFRGKNFVFDHRLAVPPEERSEVIGVCLGCESSCDDYSSRSRCPSCRMLVLLCEDCQAGGTLCELCQNT